MLHTLKYKQLLKADKQKVWDFISNPNNLKLIIPEDLQMVFLEQKVPDKIYPGMIIKYTVKPLFGLKFKWVTEITESADGDYFIDIQKSGPYKYFHHYHKIEEVPEGTLMTDIITYDAGYGFAGRFINKGIVKKRLEKIFNYREKQFHKIFNT